MRESCSRKYRYKVPLFLKIEGAASFDKRAASSSDKRAEVIHIAPCSNKRASCCQPCVTSYPQPPTKRQVVVRSVSGSPVATKGQLAVSNVTCQRGQQRAACLCCLGAVGGGQEVGARGLHAWRWLNLKPCKKGKLRGVATRRPHAVHCARTPLVTWHQPKRPLQSGLAGELIRRCDGAENERRN